MWKRPSDAVSWLCFLALLGAVAFLVVAAVKGWGSGGKLVTLGAVVLVAGVAWFLSECGVILRVMRDLAELKKQGAWSELESAYLWSLRSTGPVRWFMRRVLTVGLTELLWAGELMELGRTEEALQWVDRAQRQARFSGIQAAVKVQRAMVLQRMGRYDEALAVLDGMTETELAGVSEMVGMVRSTIYIHCGRLDDALDVARELAEDQPDSDNVGVAVSEVLRAHGDYELAAQWAMGGRPRIPDMSERELVSLRESDETSWIERDYEATSNAVQALAAATAHVAAGDLDNASKALDTAAAAHPEDWGARVLIHALRGVVAANQGDREKAERRLAKAQELAERSAQPARWSDYQEAAAQARLALGDLDQAQRHAFEADQLKVHPIERQDLAVLAGEIAEAAGKRSDAIRHYEQAVAFGIDTKRHRDAEAGLARLRG